MTRGRRVFPVLAALVLLAGMTACSRPAMTPEDARQFTRRALIQAGLADVQVLPQVTANLYRSPGAAAAVEVLQTRAAVAGGQIELYVRRRGDRAVFVRDAGFYGGQLLTPAQFDSLSRFRYDPVRDRTSDQRRRVGAAAAALVVIVATSLFSSVLTGAGERRRPRHAHARARHVRRR